MKKMAKNRRNRNKRWGSGEKLTEAGKRRYKKDLVKSAGDLMESVWASDDIDNQAMKDLTTPNSDFWKSGAGKVMIEGHKEIMDII